MESLSTAIQTNYGHGHRSVLAADTIKPLDDIGGGPALERMNVCSSLSLEGSKPGGACQRKVASLKVSLTTSCTMLSSEQVISEKPCRCRISE